MPRPKKKPDYDAEQIMRDYMNTVAEMFGAYDDRKGEEPNYSLNIVAAEFGITALKARKLLITAGVYSTALSRQIEELKGAGADINQIMISTGLRRASVHSYLPYKKIPYNLDELSANAERIRLYRKRKKKCQEFCARVRTMSTSEAEEALWEVLELLSGCIFYTTKGLKFRYTIKGGEMFVNRKSKSITQATVFMAYRRAVELDGIVAGPKKLGTFGASYLYPAFVRIGVISKLTDINQQEEGNEPISDLDNT